MTRKQECEECGKETLVRNLQTILDREKESKPKKRCPDCRD